MLPMASHCQPRLILAVPLGCQGPSHCLNTAMVYCVRLLKVTAAPFAKAGPQLALSTFETYHGALCDLLFKVTGVLQTPR